MELEQLCPDEDRPRRSRLIGCCPRAGGSVRTMLVTLLGAGCPQVHPHRFGPASLVRAGGRSVLVDCGSGVTQRLLGAGCPGAELDAVLLTHLHSDHVVDLYQLIVSSWHQGRERPQRIFGPAGTRAFAEATMAVWRREREQRIAWERRPSTAALELEVVEFEEGVVFEQDGLRIFAFEVGKVGQRAGARLLVLNHFAPVEFDRDALLREVTADFAGPVVIGEDLLTIDVPRRAVGHEGLRLALGSA